MTLNHLPNLATSLSLKLMCAIVLLFATELPYCWLNISASQSSKLLVSPRFSPSATAGTSCKTRSVYIVIVNGMLLMFDHCILCSQLFITSLDLPIAQPVGAITCACFSFVWMLSALHVSPSIIDLFVMSGAP